MRIGHRRRRPGILPHRPRRSGTRTAMSAARLPGSMLPKSSPKPSARAPVSVALSSSSRAGHARRDAPRLGQLAEHVQVGDARQAVGAERHRDVHRHRTPRAAASRRRRGRCCADTRPASRRAPAAARGPRRRTARRARPASARLEETRGRRDIRPAMRPAAPSRSFQTPSSLEQTRAGPVPCRSNSTSSADSPRCTLVSGVADARRGRREWR